MESSSQPLKRCPGCQNVFPATTEYFPPRADRKSGLQSRCKQCRRAQERRSYAEKHPKHTIPDGYKRCAGCLAIKPATTEYFTRHSRQRDGLRPQCKECDAKKRAAESLKRKAATEAARTVPLGSRQCTRNYSAEASLLSGLSPGVQASESRVSQDTSG